MRNAKCMHWLMVAPLLVGLSGVAVAQTSGAGNRPADQPPEVRVPPEITKKLKEIKEDPAFTTIVGQARADLKATSAPAGFARTVSIPLSAKVVGNWKVSDRMFSDVTASPNAAPNAGDQIYIFQDSVPISGTISGNIGSNEPADSKFTATVNYVLEGRMVPVPGGQPVATVTIRSAEATRDSIVMPGQPTGTTPNASRVGTSIVDQTSAVKETIRKGIGQGLEIQKWKINATNVAHAPSP